MIFGSHFNLTEVDEEKSDNEVLEELNYYHPRDYKPNDDPDKDWTNFGFASAAFMEEDPKTTDLLVVAAEGCILECEGEVVDLSNLGS